MNTIKLPGFDPSPTALLHTLHSLQSRKSEIKDLQKHIDHMENASAKTLTTSKRLEYQNRLNDMVESLDMLAGNTAEVTMWSIKKINIGDVVDIEFYNKRFRVTHVENVSDHKGRFVNPDHAKDTFYLLYGQIGFINAPLPLDKASKK